MKKEQYQAMESKFLYVFGLLMATFIIGGTVFASWQVQKHDLAQQQKSQRPLATASRPPNPFRSATQVTLKVPYRHGRNKDTLNYIAALKQKSAQTLPQQGFSTKGVYVSHQGQKKNCQLRFYCPSSTCFMEVELSTRHFLRPHYQGKKIVYPKRHFAILVHGYIIEVEESKIVGIGSNNEKNLALFDDSVDLQSTYREIYKTGTSQ